MFPLARLAGRKFPSIYSSLTATEGYSRCQLKELQLSKLRQILGYAYENVPNIRERMESAGVKPFHLRNLEKLGDLPTTSKDVMRSQSISSLTDNNRPLYDLYEDGTSGSTGEPFIFYKDQHKRDFVEAIKIRNFRWIGASYGEKYFSLWGFMPNQGLVSKFFQNVVTRRKRLSSDASIEEMKNYIELLEDNPGSYLEGYTSALVLMARVVLDSEYDPDLAGVISSAETLFDPYRELMESAFNCEVFNRYGTREFGDISMETLCHNGLHIHQESFVVEVLTKEGEPAKEGEVGEITVTDLENYAMPFIRYRTGDIVRATHETDSCRLSHSLMGDPLGRLVDYIRVGDKVISFGYLVLTFEEHPEIRQFQLEQISDNKLILKVVKGTEYNEDLMDSLLEKIRSYCSPLEVDLEFVKEIPPEASGKMRIVKSMRSSEEVRLLTDEYL